MSISKLLISLLVTLAATVLYESRLIEHFETYENQSLDWRFGLRNQQYTDDKILVVEIDSASVQFMGGQSFDAADYAELIDALNGMGARLVAFNMVLRNLPNSADIPLLVNSMKRAGNVYLAMNFDAEEDGRVRGSRLPTFFKDSAKGLGHVLIKKDQDGVVRRGKVIVSDSRRDYPSLALALAMDLYETDASRLEIGEFNIRLPISNHPAVEISLTKSRDALLNWPGKWARTFRRVSMKDVLSSYRNQMLGEPSELPDKLFHNAICIIGVTAPGHTKVIRTPLEKGYPPVGVTATALNSFLQRKFLKTPMDSTNLIILWTLGIIFYFSMIQGRLLPSVLRLVVMMLVYSAIGILIFKYMDTALFMAYPSGIFVACIIIVTVFQWIVTNMEKRKLLRLVTRDELTNLTKYDHFTRLLEAEMNKSKTSAEKKDLSLVMIDIDHFKRVNDTYGHLAGDEVIRAISEIIRNHCRTLDVGCRFGGEEFILLLAGVNRMEAVKIADRMRRIIELREFPLGKQKKIEKITASFGVTSLNSADESMPVMMKRLDEALYQAKNGGRNMVCWL